MSSSNRPWKRTAQQLTVSLAVALAMALLASPAQADPPLPEIIKRTNLASYYQGQDGRARVKMTITDKQGRSRMRELTILRRDHADGGKQSFYMYFHSPADVAKMSFLVHKHPGADDDRWLYMPALDLEKRIAGADKRTSFAGSDFFYEDVSGRAPSEDHHALVKTTGNYYVLKHTPKKPGAVEFSHYIMHVHKTTFLPTKVQFFDKGGNLERVMTTLKVKKIQGYSTVVKASMEDKKRGSTTVLEFSGVKYDMGLPAKVFRKRSLRRAPMKHLR
jgi:outer membrane lipoprotein-sorting protein